MTETESDVEISIASISSLNESLSSWDRSSPTLEMDAENGDDNSSHAESAHTASDDTIDEFEENLSDMSESQSENSLSDSDTSNVMFPTTDSDASSGDFWNESNRSGDWSD